MPAIINAAQFTATLNALADSCHAVALDRFPYYSERHRAGEPVARTRAHAREAALHGLAAMAKIQAAGAFDRRWPTDAAYDTAHARWLAENGAQPAAKPTALAAAPAQTPPPPSIRVRSDLKSIESAAAAAGAIFATKLADTLAKIAGYTNAQRIDFRHAGRDYVIFAAEVSPFPGTFKAVKPMVRVAMVDAECDANVDAFASVTNQLKKAIEDRDAYAADKKARELGSPDGFDTRVVGI